MNQLVTIFQTSFFATFSSPACQEAFPGMYSVNALEISVNVSEINSKESCYEYNLTVYT